MKYLLRMFKQLNSLQGLPGIEKFQEGAKVSFPRIHQLEAFGHTVADDLEQGFKMCIKVYKHCTIYGRHTDFNITVTLFKDVY